MFNNWILFNNWLLCWMGGIFVDQASDWGKHNAILADLVKKDWPVYYINGGGI